MKKILTALLLLLPLSLFAQKFPTDTETGRIVYTEVVPVEGATKKELYTKARNWVATEFKSANNVIQMDTEDVIVVKGITHYTTVSMGQPTKSDLHFLMTIELKDGRYKYTTTNFSSDGKAPIESDLLNPKVIYKKDGTVREFYAGSVKGIEAGMTELNNSLKTALSAPKKSDW